jgi:large subunit ribosomal protein L29
MRKLTVDELKKKLEDFKSELFNLRFQHAINQLENPMRIKKVKKNIARILTIIAEMHKKKVCAECPA